MQVPLSVKTQPHPKEITRRDATSTATGLHISLTYTESVVAGLSIDTSSGQTTLYTYTSFCINLPIYYVYALVNQYNIFILYINYLFDYYFCTNFWHLDLIFMGPD